MFKQDAEEDEQCRWEDLSTMTYEEILATAILNKVKSSKLTPIYKIFYGINLTFIDLMFVGPYF